MKYNYSQANNLPRGFSFFLDIGLIVALMVALNKYFIISELLSIFISILLYFFYCYIEYRYTTLGKLLFSHRVLNTDFKKPSFWKIMVRNIIKLPFFAFFAIFYFIPLFWVIIIAMSIFGLDFNKSEMNSMRFIYDKLLGTNIYNIKHKQLSKSIDNLSEVETIKTENTYKSFSLLRFYFDDAVKLKDLNIFNRLGFKYKRNELKKDEIIIFSIVFGVVIGLMMGYLFGKNHYDRYNVVYKVDYLLFFSGFIVSAGICYLYLNKKK